MRDGGKDCGCFGRRVDHVASTLAALLAHPDVDCGQSEGGSFHDAAGRVADYRVYLAQKTPISDSVEVDEDVRVRHRARQSLRAFDEREAAGVGVGIDENELAGRLSEGGEEGIGLGVGVVQDGDRMPGDEQRGRRECKAELCFEGLTAQQG